MDSDKEDSWQLGGRDPVAPTRCAPLAPEFPSRSGSQIGALFYGRQQSVWAVLLRRLTVDFVNRNTPESSSHAPGNGRTAALKGSSETAAAISLPPHQHCVCAWWRSSRSASEEVPSSALTNLVCLRRLTAFRVRDDEPIGPGGREPRPVPEQGCTRDADRHRLLPAEPGAGERHAAAAHFWAGRAWLQHTGAVPPCPAADAAAVTSSRRSAAGAGLQ